MMNLSIENVKGLGEAEALMLNELLEIFSNHLGANAVKEKYYEGYIGLNDVNLGIALPDGIGKLKIGCEWGKKTVDVLASRSMFDGFVSTAGIDAENLTKFIEDNKFFTQYLKAVKDELKFGCTFATLSGDGKGGCKARFHSPRTAAAKWNGAKQRIDCGFAIIDSVPDESEEGTWTPSHINLYTEDAIWEIVKNKDEWVATPYYHKMGQPLMVPMVWSPDSDKPFGTSRINYPIRALIDGYIRTIANASIALEFDTAPQKYLLGVTDEQYDRLITDKFKQYVGNMLISTNNPESGEKPSFGQLPQGNLQPHVEMIRILATQFSAASGLTVTDTGVVNDANPTSSEAIIAQSQTLICLAEQLNKSNGDALRLIAHMAQAIMKNVSLDELTEEEINIIAHFKNPAMPSVSVTADAAMKIAGAREGFAGTDTFLEMIGFSQADIRRIKGQEALARGRQVLEVIEG